MAVSLINTERNAGKPLKCPALLRAETIFSRRRGHLAKAEREECKSDKQSA
jgi:hypothetical protein